MKVSQFNIFSSFQLAWIALVVIFIIPMLISAQNENDSLWLEIDTVKQEAIYDIPASHEKSEDIIYSGELIRTMENYYIKDDSIFSVTDYLDMVSEKYPDINPVVQVRSLEFPLKDYISYVSLRGRVYQKSEFFYSSNNQIERIVINP